ncbi:hypothetical protein MVEN_00013000 [Mycena venus]|uniref:Uncharacterized protein n=1 Tax=Mycena venus TaxID=2733690 RepID=A0A8H7DHH2_9AGAR|nr:hypothetical protein MVEN_00013000 [Mycena venus]
MFMSAFFPWPHHEHVRRDARTQKFRMSAGSTPPPNYTPRADNVDMDTNVDMVVRANPDQDSTSDNDTDDSMPDLVPPSDDEHVTCNGQDDGTKPGEAPSVRESGGLTTLIQHIGSFNIAGSVSSDVHRGRRPTISADPRRDTNTSANVATTSAHAHATKLRGEARAANQAIREAVLDSLIEETGRNRRFNNNRCGPNPRFNTPTRAPTSTHFIALLERIHRLEMLLRRLQRLVRMLNTQL